ALFRCCSTCDTSLLSIRSNKLLIPVQLPPYYSRRATMKAIFPAAILLVIAVTSFGADRPPVPDRPIAIKKELLFSDDFEGSNRSPLWHRVVPTFVFENGVLKGTQTRDKNIPAENGKPAVTAHAAVHGLELPTKD